MKIAAVIAEYNPFHNGHLYQLRTIKEKLGADHLLILMSGDFVQRGEPALWDKYTRCRLALEQGADVVFELPVYYALGSAEYFAQGAVSLLDKLGVVSYLHFGSESGDCDALLACADALLKESPAFQAQLQTYLKSGIPFPAARSRALTDTITLPPTLNKEAAQQLLSAPNNILGIEYCKALLKRKSPIRPATLCREGSGYSQTDLSSEYASARAVRQYLSEREQDSCKAFASLRPYLPERVYQHLVEKGGFETIFPDDLSTILHYKLLSESVPRSFETYYDITPQLSDLFVKNLSNFQDFQAFCMTCKTRNLTYSRISRSLMHILLDMKQDTITQLRAQDDCQYARLLGFSKEGGSEVLSAIKANTSIPVITRLPKAVKELTGIAQTSLLADLHAAEIYQCIRSQKYHLPAVHEYSRQIVILNS